MSLSRLPRLIESYPLSFILKFEGEAKQSTLLLEQCKGGWGGTFLRWWDLPLSIYHSPQITPYPWGTPYDGLYREAPPERGTFFHASGI